MKLPSIGIITPNDFVKRLPFGGASGFILNLINAMDNQITIFGAGVNGTPLWKPKDICHNVFFVATYSISIPNNFPLRLKALLGYMKNRKQILLSDIDILYVHSPECAIPFLYGKRRKPIVFHQHGSGNPVSTAKFVWARNKLILWLFDQIHQAIYRRANWIISIDQLCLDQVRKSGAAWKTTLIMNAVDTSRFHPDYRVRKEMRAESSVSSAHLALLFVGRLEEIKQVNLLIKSLLHVVPKFPLHLFIIGDGTKRESLKALTQRLGLASAVHFLGKVSHDILHRWYNMADALVLPSKMEGVPMVILESLACGTPVVAASVGGIPDLVTTGENGILINAVTVENIASAIVSIKQQNLPREMVSATVSQWSSIRVSNILSGIFRYVSQRAQEETISDD
jgi:glycosyltransferase involved in cell wall biosynthesis